MNGSFNSSYSHSFQQGNDMMNFFLSPEAIKAENNKFTTTLQTKIPQTNADTGGKETFNDMTRKSLLKINLFIKRLKWFNIFTEPKSTEINQKW
jgi:hypothetical protein